VVQLATTYTLKMKQHILIAASVALIGSPAFAGGYSSKGAGEVTPPPVVEEPFTLGATVSVGYDTKYMFRGVDFGDNLVHSGLELALPFGDIVELTLGAWYGDVVDSSFSELDLFAELGFDLGLVSVAVGYTYYYFPDGGDGAHEPYLGLGFGIGPVEIGLTGYAESEADEGEFGYYAELTADYSVELGGPVSLDVGALISYGWNYYGVDDWNNIQASIGLPIALTSTATLTPYIAYSWALDGLTDIGQGDELFGGIALEVTF